MVFEMLLTKVHSELQVSAGLPLEDFFLTLEAGTTFLRRKGFNQVHVFVFKYRIVAFFISSFNFVTTKVVCASQAVIDVSTVNLSNCCVAQ